MLWMYKQTTVWHSLITLYQHHTLYYSVKWQNDYEWWIGNNTKVVVFYFKTLSQDFPGSTEENDETFESGKLVHVDTGTWISWIQSRSDNHYTATISKKLLQMCMFHHHFWNFFNHITLLAIEKYWQDLTQMARSSHKNNSRI
jgi:hypothetical protein